MPYVAKSYEGLPVVEEEYTKNGRTYCKVRTVKGTIKEVRTYTEAEYKKLYSSVSKTVSSKTEFNQKKALGFDKGYITIFKGAVAANEHFFEKGPFRYSRWTGWYLPSNEIVPALPEGVTSKILPWEIIGMDNGKIKEEKQLFKDFSNFVRTN